MSWRDDKWAAYGAWVKKAMARQSDEHDRSPREPGGHSTNSFPSSAVRSQPSHVPFNRDKEFQKLGTIMMAANRLGLTGVPSLGSSYPGEILGSEQGAMLAAWATGSARRYTQYGPESSMTRAIRDQSSTAELGARAKIALSSGNPSDALSLSGGYDAGDPNIFNANLWRDVRTIAFYPLASEADRTLLAIGTYELKVSDIQTMRGQRALVTFTAINDTTAGSMLRGIGNPTVWNALAGSAGPLSQTTQTFTWTETLSW